MLLGFPFMGSRHKWTSTLEHLREKRNTVQRASKFQGPVSNLQSLKRDGENSSHIVWSEHYQILQAMESTAGKSLQYSGAPVWGVITSKSRTSASKTVGRGKEGKMQRTFVRLMKKGGCWVFFFFFLWRQRAPSCGELKGNDLILSDWVYNLPREKYHYLP